MELIPWRPFGGELDSFRREMDRLWERFIGERPFARKNGEQWLPSVDVSETKDSIVVKAELPGTDSKDIDVSISGNVLTIKGEKKEEQEEKDEHRHYVERYHGSFQRSFQLPAEVKTDKIDATFDKGVLKITLPKTEQAKKKEIQIKVK
jgi:HSP20 family protein